MPGDLKGSPMLTFAPLAVEEGAELGHYSALPLKMERRYEAYKAQDRETVFP